MTDYQRKPAFSGGWDEELNNCRGLYNTLSKMCEFTEEELLKSLQIMLTGDALNLF